MNDVSNLNEFVVTEQMKNTSKFVSHTKETGLFFMLISPLAMLLYVTEYVDYIGLIISMVTFVLALLLYMKNSYGIYLAFVIFYLVVTLYNVAVGLLYLLFYGNTDVVSFLIVRGLIAVWLLTFFKIKVNNEDISTYKNLVKHASKMSNASNTLEFKAKKNMQANYLKCIFFPNSVFVFTNRNLKCYIVPINEFIANQDKKELIIGNMLFKVNKKSNEVFSRLNTILSWISNQRFNNYY